MSETAKIRGGIRRLSLSCHEDAARELARIGVDPAGMARMIPKLDSMHLLIPSVRPPAANILKQEMLSIGGDAAVARGTVACSIESTDVLLIGNRSQLERLCCKLEYQPFGLKSLSSSIRAQLDLPGQRQAFWCFRNGRLSLERPLVMGILNITPDSFSDGGRFINCSDAVEHALEMIDEGADIIDIGGESTRPGASGIPEEEELRRVLPVIEAIAGRSAIPLSIDTWKSGVARAAIDSGASIVNDISALSFDPGMVSVIAESNAGAVLMHTRGRPQTMQNDIGYRDLMGEVAESLENSADLAISNGVKRESIVIDPGIGFGKDMRGNLELLRRLGELTSLGYPLLVGTSRKSFIGRALGRENPDERLFGTAATVAIAVANGASIIRVHDVRAMRDVADMAVSVTEP